MEQLKKLQRIKVNLPLKFVEHQKLQTELIQLRSQINQKKNLFDQGEYQSINQRINACQNYFKSQKEKLIQQEKYTTYRNDNSKERITTTVEKANQYLPKKHKSHSYHKNENPLFHIKVNTKPYQRECLKLKNKVHRIDYPNEFSKAKSYVQSNRMLSKVVVSERIKSQRYISQFQQRIKQSLSKITQLNFKYQSQYQIEKNLINQNRSLLLQLQDEFAERKQIKIHKKSSLDQRQKIRNYEDYKKIIKNQQDRKTHQHRDHFHQLQKRVQRCKTQLKEKHYENIKRLSKQKLDYYQKSQRFDKMYGQFDEQDKNGNSEALDLMCMVTLAKADILLTKI